MIDFYIPLSYNAIWGRLGLNMMEEKVSTFHNKVYKMINKFIHSISRDVQQAQ